jgi:hypothetical protein
MSTVNLENVRNEFKLTEAEMQLWQQKINTYKFKETKERAFVRSIAQNVFADHKTETAQYLEAHKFHTEAEVQLMELQLARLKAKCAILDATIKEAESGIIHGNKAGLIQH